MDTVQDFTLRFEAMPPELQRQVSDYADFLSSRYSSPDTLSPEMTAFLDDRIAKMDASREGDMKLEEFREKMNKKYGRE